MATDAVPGTHLFKHDPDSHAFPAGAILFEAGDIGTEMFVIQEGTVELVFDGEVVETLGEGGIFGEGALVDESHRRAGTARAVTDVRVAIIDERRFRYLVERSPFFAIEVMRALAFRLKRTTQQLHA